MDLYSGRGKGNLAERPLMKSNRTFWYIFVGSVVLLVVGYLGFVSMPDKTTGYMIPVVLLCLLMIGIGAIGLVGGLVLGVVRAVDGRKTPETPKPEEQPSGAGTDQLKG